MNNTANIEEQQNKKYRIKLKEFEGPLDLLLHLVKTSEIDIYDISIAEITNQYLKYLFLLISLNIDNISEFVEMATILILIKSKTMLPVELDFQEYGEDPREGLISKLLEYQKYKMAAGLLETKSEESVPFINKNSDNLLFKFENDHEENWRQLSVLDLIGAFTEVLNKKDKVDAGLELLLYNFTVDEKIQYIHSILKDSKSFNYFDLIKEDMPKIELICIFLALLELIKKGVIAVRQHIIFGDIHIVSR